MNAGNLFSKAKQAVEKAKKVAADNPDKIKGGIDKVAEKANTVTKGKYSDKIDKATHKVEDAVAKQTQGKGQNGPAESLGEQASSGSTRRPGEVADPVERPSKIDDPEPI